MADRVPVGRLVLVPNALDHGSGVDVRLDAVLPAAVIERAARLRHWVVEDARSARAFLKRVGALVPLEQPLQSLSIVELPRRAKGRANASPEPAATPNALLRPALEGHELGLLSEAGLPALADPGAVLVAAAHAAGVTVETLPGSSSIALALASSGLDGQCFAFVGYLPIDAAERHARIRKLEEHSAREAQTQVAIETPYRNASLMEALVRHLAPGTRLSVACGLTLPLGWTRTMTVERWRKTGIDFPEHHPAVFAWLAELRRG